MTLSAFLYLLANHVWQSTLFAVAAGLLAMAFRKNHARTRYWIWWIASLKFFVPFSLLVTLGSSFSWQFSSPSVAVEPVPVLGIERVTQPFTSNAVFARLSAAPDGASAEDSESFVPIVVAAIWVCGAILILARWRHKWSRARAAISDGSLHGQGARSEGREIEVLRRLQQRVGERRSLRVFTSKSAMEPSVFGFLRPALIWPAGLSMRLTDEELEGILLHELSHVRRHDNLTAALHMVIESVFWFHPLVWWIGMRLVDERERACDEQVLRWGGVSHQYAEGILKVCEYCLESPLVCAAGITGASLKKRIEDIARDRVGRQLGVGRMALLGAAAILAVGGPIALGVLYGEASARPEVRGLTEAILPLEPRLMKVIEEQAPLAKAPAVASPTAARPGQGGVQKAPAFEVISIRPATGAPPAGFRGGPGQRGGGGAAGPTACGGIIQMNPGRFIATNVSLYRLVAFAYGRHCRLSTEQKLMTGGPDWTESVAYDIQATLPEGSPTYTMQQLQDGEAPVLQMMIRNMLVDRFKLSLHRNTKEVPVYNLVLVKMGRIKLSEDQTPLPPPSPTPAPFDPAASPRGTFGIGVNPPAGKVSISATAIPISSLINFIQGGVGRMVVDKTEPKGLYDIPRVELDVGPFDITPGAVTVWPEIMSQLGLRMDPTSGPAEVLVIDRVEKPSEN
jgi:bla regulator protein BlaR1